MFSRFDRRASAFSLLGSVVLTAAFVILIYVASPLRDPAFQPNSANAGSLVPWLKFMGEQQWIQAATLFAVLLATNLTIFLYQLSVAGDRVADHPYRRLPDRMQIPASLSLWFAAWLLLTGTFWILLLTYLLVQWLVD